MSTRRRSWTICCKAIFRESDSQLHASELWKKTKLPPGRVKMFVMPSTNCMRAAATILTITPSNADYLPRCRGTGLTWVPWMRLRRFSAVSRNTTSIYWLSTVRPNNRSAAKPKHPEQSEVARQVRASKSGRLSKMDGGHRVRPGHNESRLDQAQRAYGRLVCHLGDFEIVVALVIGNCRLGE